MSKYKKIFCLLLMIISICTSCNKDDANIIEVKNLAYRRVNSVFDTVNVEEVYLSENIYTVLCSAALFGEMFDLYIQVELQYAKVNEKWKLINEPTYDYNKVDFHIDSDKFYYFRASDMSELFQIQTIGSGSITVRNYGFESARSVPGLYIDEDEFYNGTETWDLQYLADLRCFEFSYYNWIPYRIYHDHIEAGYKTHHWYTGNEYFEYNKISSKNPKDYWWFEKAVNASSMEN